MKYSDKYALPHPTVFAHWVKEHLELDVTDDVALHAWLESNTAISIFVDTDFIKNRRNVSWAMQRITKLDTEDTEKYFGLYGDFMHWCGIHIGTFDKPQLGTDFIPTFIFLFYTQVMIRLDDEDDDAVVYAEPPSDFTIN